MKQQRPQLRHGIVWYAVRGYQGHIGRTEESTTPRVGDRNHRPKSVGCSLADGYEKACADHAPCSSLRVSCSLMFAVARLASSFSVLYFSYRTSFVRILSICQATNQPLPGRVETPIRTFM